jgi:hypothetical protein
MHLSQSAFLCLGNTPWAPPWSWPFACSSTFSFFQFLAPQVLYNHVFHVNRIFRNLAFRVGQILSKPDFHVSKMTRTSFFMLHVANLANLICPSIRAAIWAKTGSLANPICLPVLVAILANPVKPAQVMLLRLANSVNSVATPIILKYPTRPPHHSWVVPHLISLGTSCPLVPEPSFCPYLHEPAH